jgi:hypothetical protein
MVFTTSLRRCASVGARVALAGLLACVMGCLGTTSSVTHPDAANVEECSPGTNTACVSSNGSPGEASCLADGTLGPCVCQFVTVCVAPNPVDFGNVQVGGTPVTMTVTLTNCGSSPANVTFEMPTTEGPNASDYVVSGLPSTVATLAVNETISLGVGFSPSVTGASTADIPYSLCSGCTTQKVNLAGFGVDCTLTFTPDPVRFGNVQAGMTVSQMVTLANTGTEECDIIAFVTQSTNSDYALTTPPIPIALQVGQMVGISIFWTPQADGLTVNALIATYTVPDPALAARTAIDPINPL